VKRTETEHINEEPAKPAANPRPEVTPQDRWAQIRKNAAERAAQRASEEQSYGGQSSKTDDGETSGEESKCSPFVVFMRVRHY
jgi:hypothetical protein